MWLPCKGKTKELGKKNPTFNGENEERFTKKDRYPSRTENHDNPVMEQQHCLTTSTHTVSYNNLSKWEQLFSKSCFETKKKTSKQMQNYTKTCHSSN